MKLVHCLAFAVIAFSQTVSATGSALPGTTRTSLAGYDEWDSPDTFSVITLANRSIYCRGIPATGTDHISFSTTAFEVKPTGSAGPTISAVGTADGGETASEAISFTADVKGQYALNIAASSVGTGTSSSAKGNISCHDTTLFGSFNTITAANPVNYLELKNLSGSSVDAKITLYSAAGAALGSLNRTIAAGQRADIALHEVSGASNTFGSIIITNNGSLGALVGNVSKYQVSGSNVSITATEPLHVRAQN